MYRTLLPVLLTVFLDLIGFGVVIPLLSFYAGEHGATPLQITLLMAVYSLAQFVMAPVWGALSDRYGRRPILLLSVGATSVCLLGFSLADSVPMLFLFRTLHGVATANISTAQAAVADVTPPEKRAMGLGMIGAAFGVGFTLGPLLGGELSTYGLAVPIQAAAALSAVNFALTLALLPETRKPGAGPVRVRSLHPARFLEVARHPVVGLCVVLTFCLTLAFGAMESTFSLFAEHRWDLSAQAVGRMFGAAGLVMIIIQGGLIGRLVKRVGEGPLIPLGVGVLAVGLALLPLARPTGPMVAVFILIAIGQGIANPSLQSLISRGADEHEQGFVLGTNQSMSALARALGPALGGLLFTGVSMDAPFWAAAVVVAACVGLALVAVRQHQRARTAAQPSA